jgi:serine-type D-Ala-D-Ala carboxypeptidase/endopeptidase
VTPSTLDEGRIRAVLARHARRHVGVAVGVRRDGETVVLGRGRIAAERPEAPGGDTIFEIGSVTKVFTATALALAVGEGSMALDDPVQRWLPTDVRLPVRGRPITLADLATHTSGLPRLPRGLLRRALRERHNPYASFGAEDLRRAIPATRPRRRPGRFRYSNYGFGLLGHVLALRAGTTYEALIAERVCAPLGLADTSVAVPEAKRARFAQGHTRWGRPTSHWDLPALPGAGALRSTVLDLLVFLDAQLAAGAGPLGDAIRATHDPRVRRRTLSVGLGWMISTPVRGRRWRVLWHDGGTGGFRSAGGFVPETRTAVVVLSNSARSTTIIGVKVLEALA